MVSPHFSVGQVRMQLPLCGHQRFNDGCRVVPKRSTKCNSINKSECPRLCYFDSHMGTDSPMNCIGYAISWILVFLVSQVQGEESVTLNGRIEASEDQTHSVWIGVFELPILPGAEALSWTEVNSTEFSLTVPNVNELQIVALRKGFLPLSLQINPRLANARVDLEFQRGNTLEGIVLSTDHIPIANAVLRLYREDLPSIQIPNKFSWKSDADGQFKIGGLAGSAKYQLHVSARRVREGMFAVQMPRNGNHHQDLRLSNAYFVQGRVVDLDGVRIQAATVSRKLTHEQWRELPLTTSTNGAGKFQMGPFPGNKEIWLRARHDEHGSSKKLQTTSGELELELILRGLVQVVGTVIDASTGALIDDFKLEAIQQDGNRSHPHLRSNGQLSCLVDSASIGLIIVADEYMSYVTSDLDLNFVDSFDLGVIALDPARRLTGQVYDASNGVPISGATVSHFYSRSVQAARDDWLQIISNTLTDDSFATTNENGEFTLNRLPVETTQLSVSAQRYQEKEVQVDSAIAEFDIPLEREISPSARIRGRVETTAGIPVSGNVHFVTKVEPRKSVVVYVNSDGFFDFSIEPNAYDVFAITNDGVTETVTIAVAEDEAREVTLVLESNGRLKGFIEGLGDGETVNVNIYSDSKLSTVKRLSEIGNGEFQLSGLGTGAFNLTATSSRNRTQARTFEIREATDEVAVELTFSGNSRLYGTLRFPDGSVPNGRVSAVAKREGQTSSSAWVASDGTFEIEHLDEGDYTVHIWHRRRIELSREDGSGFSSTTFEPIDETEVTVRGETELYIELPHPFRSK